VSDKVSDKVKLPRKIAEAINRFDSFYKSDKLFEIHKYVGEETAQADAYEIVSWMNEDSDNTRKYYTALVNGYEVQQNPEEEAIQWLIKKRCIERGFSEHDIVMGIKSILSRGVNAE
jgi:hypothetical protein